MLPPLILTREPDAARLADVLESAPSPIAVFEAVAGICRKRRTAVVAPEFVSATLALSTTLAYTVA